MSANIVLLHRCGVTSSMLALNDNEVSRMGWEDNAQMSWCHDGDLSDSVRRRVLLDSETGPPYASSKMATKKADCRRGGIGPECRVVSTGT
jgi:hypothetical protein